MTAREIIEAEDPKNFLRRVQADKQAVVSAQVEQAWDKSVHENGDFADAWMEVLFALVPNADQVAIREAAEFLNVRGMDLGGDQLWDDGTEVTADELCHEAMSHTFHSLPELNNEQRIAIERLWKNVYSLV